MMGFSKKSYCNLKGIKYAFSNLNKVKKVAWFFGGVWFFIHIPAIAGNALGVLALGAGGGTHLHDISNLLGINISLQDATTEAMVSAGLFSGSLGLYKYIDLKTKNNDGSKKRPSTKYADPNDIPLRRLNNDIRPTQQREFAHNDNLATSQHFRPRPGRRFGGLATNNVWQRRHRQAPVVAPKPTKYNNRANFIEPLGSFG